MIISRTPYRLSFFGGGTDYAAWCEKEEGAVLSTTIDKYCYLTCRVLPPFFNIKYRIVWSHIETVSCISEILHPAVREGLRLLAFDEAVGLEIHHQGDLPARAGIGSSSSFAVGLIHALKALRGQTIDKQSLASMAITLEQDCLREHVGAQDQVAAAYGGFNLIRFEKAGIFHVEPLVLPPSRLQALQRRLLLFYTGSSRLASTIAAEVIGNFAVKRTEMRRMRAMVDQSLAILTGTGDLDDFGRLLDEAWRIKRGLGSSVSSPTLDHVYQAAMDHGAVGGKLLGAGGAGFMLFYAPEDRHADLHRALPQCVPVSFKFEREGSVLLHGSE